MANQSAERFVKQVVAFCCRRFKPDAYQVELYKQKLSRWYLTEDQWAAAMEKIERDYGDEGLPSLKYIYGFLVSVQDVRETDYQGTQQLFTRKGLRIVMATKDRDGKGWHPMKINPANPPALPPGATDEHIVIPQDLQARQDEQDYSKQITELTEIAAEVPF